MRLRVCFQWLEDFYDFGFLRVVGLETDEPAEKDIKDIYEKPFMETPDYTLWAVDPESGKRYRIVVEEYEILDVWEVKDLPDWLC